MTSISLGDRMKSHEKHMLTRCLPLLPICARLDGKAFHTWTRDLQRPFDERLHKLFVATTEFLVKETQARIGYTQSDEITLIWYSGDIESQIFFDGKVQKMVSVLASMATAYFNREVSQILCVPEYCPNAQAGCRNLASRSLAFFDCRIWQVPTLEEAANVLVWRELDATRNSIQMAAQAQFGHKELLYKNNSDMQEMLHQKGINWNDYPDWAKKGTYVQRRKCVRTLSPDEYARIPEKHRPDLGSKIERTDVVHLQMPPITKITNRVEVLFYGEKPCSQ